MIILLTSLLLTTVWATDGDLTFDCKTYLLNAYRNQVDGKGEMVEHRDLFDFGQQMDPTLPRALANLHGNQIWLNVGPGQLRAELDYLTLEGEFPQPDGLKDKANPVYLLPKALRVRPRAIAVSRPRKGIPPEVQVQIDRDAIDYRLMSLHEYALKFPNSVDHLTERKGSAIYTKLDQSFLDMLAAVKVNGRIDVDVQYISIFDENGKWISIYEYFKRGTGFRIISDQEANEYLAAIKTSDKFSLPKLRVKSTRWDNLNGPITAYQIEPK